MKIAKYILPLIVISQFFCTSLWFAGNGVMADLIVHFNLQPSALGHLTSAVQFGFISGTLVFALFTLADRFSPSRVFFASALLGSLFNLGILMEGNSLLSLALLRSGTGFFLAGIYPVGMKIAADYFEKGLGKSLGFLVGALVLGTALPHLLKGLAWGIPWPLVIWFTSGLALAGGIIMISLVPDGPFRKPSKVLDFSVSFKVFRNPPFRAAAFGYFGHMWELYAFWAFVPVMIEAYKGAPSNFQMNTATLSFLVIGIGGPACMFAGKLSEKLGARQTAGLSLLISCCCCLISPLIFMLGSPSLFISFILIWGAFVVSDSPLFSTMVARNSQAENKGTALTIVNCIGFAITIFSIQLLNYLRVFIDPHYMYLFLAPGPILGLWALYRKNGPQLS